ncbi:MAG: tetratricopeptide repeat protein [bacterium]
MKKVLTCILVSVLFFVCSCVSVRAAETKDKTDSQKKADAHYRMGIDSMYKGKHFKAKRELSIAVEYAPDIPVYHNHLGLLHYKLGEYEKAEKLFMKSYELDNSYSDPLNNLAVLYIHQKKYDEAWNLLEKVEKDSIYPNPQFVYSNKGIILKNKGKLNEAEKEFKRALKLKPKYCEAHNELGKLYEMKNLDEKAAYHYSMSVKFCPSFVESLYRGAVRYFALKQEDKGKEFLKKCVEIESENTNELTIPFMEDCLRLAETFGINEKSEKEEDRKRKKREIEDIKR